MTLGSMKGAIACSLWLIRPRDRLRGQMSHAFRGVLRLLGGHAIALALLLGLADPSWAERRVALVIGNANYTQQSDKLRNPHNDAQDMAIKLQSLGFKREDIVYRLDLKVDQIDSTLDEFRKKISDDTVALVFYSGHGMQVNGRNYLPAIDAKIQNEFAVKRQSIVVSDLMDLLESSKSRVNLLFLDACRDNPFNLGNKAFNRGLTKESPPAGTWVAYATRYGQVADDGTGRNGTFTAALLNHIGTPNLPLEEMFRRVANDVVNATRHKERRQQPWPEGWTSERFFFVQTAPTVAPTPVPIAQLPAPKPGDLIKDCSDCPELVLLPTGSFMMGSPDGEKDRLPSEGPVHKVTISRPIAVGRFEVSRGEFATFVQRSGYKTEAERSDGCTGWDGKTWTRSTQFSWRNLGFAQADDHPVVCVSWNDTQAYVKWLNEQLPSLPGGKKFRLLTEAEWEYAARANQGTKRFPWGDDLDYSVMCRWSNVADQTTKKEVPLTAAWATNCNDNHAYTAPGGAFPANAFGLHNLHGNAWEWVQDRWHDNYNGAPTDGQAWETGSDERRVLRGGSWYILPRDLRSALRGRIAPGDRSDVGAGFRVARTF